MKQSIVGPSMPTAQICINKSRLRIYQHEGQPTFYLNKGQEFQIELFNPTSDTILAKIELNGKRISQGGLVLRPGERVFLERYIDVAKKFMFDTYEVSNTSEVKQAIKSNGDFKVEFFRESRPLLGSVTTYTTPIYEPLPYTYTYPYNGNLQYGTANINSTGGSNITLSNSNNPNTLLNAPTSGQLNVSSLCGSSTKLDLSNASNTSYFNGEIAAGGAATFNSKVTTDSLSFHDGDAASDFADGILRSRTTKLKTLQSLVKEPKTIETGRVEAGSSSSQKLEAVSKSFDYYPFHTLVYKLLPVSQKVNTSSDIKIKRYCTNCGTGQKPEFKFCPTCGQKS